MTEKNESEELPFCECGCGKEANRGKWYIGHWNKGRKRPDLTLRNNKKNPMKSIDAQKKLSNIFKERYINPENYPRYGLKHTQESKALISEKKKKYYKTKKGICMSKKLSDVHKGKHRSPSTEVKKGQHLSPSTELKKGHISWITDKKGIIIGYKFQKGSAHPLWKNGVSYEPYCDKFNEDLKERVREFFGRCCYLCGKNENDNGQKLSVHHVNYNKMACCEEEIRPLFVPLCISCHSKTHGDREEWEELFTVSLDYLTDGECFIHKTEETGVKN